MSFSSVALNSRTGIDTSPKEIAPFQMLCGMRAMIVPNRPRRHRGCEIRPGHGAAFVDKVSDTPAGACRVVSRARGTVRA